MRMIANHWQAEAILLHDIMSVGEVIRIVGLPDGYKNRLSGCSRD